MTFNKPNYQEIKSLFTVNNFVVLLVFLFPITAATVKGASSIIVGLLLIIGLATFRFKDLKLLDKDKYIFIGFLALFVVGALSMINTENTAEGLKRLERLIAFPLSIFIYLYFLKNRLSLVSVLINGAMIAAVVMAWQAWYQVEVLGYKNAIGTYHKIIFGDVAMLIAVMLMAHAYFKANNWKTRFLFAVLIAFALYASLLSNTRGAWVLLPVLFISFSFYLFLKKGVSTRSVTIVSLLIIVLGVVLFSNEYIYQKLTSELIKIPDYLNETSYVQGSFHWRIVVWKMCLQIWAHNPLLGTGLGDYPIDSALIIKNGYMDGAEGFIVDHAHSMYFDALATSGLLGLLAVVGSLILIPGYLAKSHHKINGSYVNVILFVCVTSFAVFGLSEGVLSRKVFINIYLLLIIVILVSGRLGGSVVSYGVCGSSDIAKTNKYVVIMLLLIVFFFILSVLINYVTGVVKYNSLALDERILKDLSLGVYKNKRFVVSEKLRNKKAFNRGFGVPYIYRRNEDFSCYPHSNNLYLYSYSDYVNMGGDEYSWFGSNALIKYYYSSEEVDDSFVVTSEYFAAACALKNENIDMHDLLTSKNYPIRKKLLSMYSNGYLLTPAFDVLKRRYRVEMVLRSDCSDERCARLKVEVYGYNSREEGFYKVDNYEINTTDTWQKYNIYYKSPIDSKMFLKINFVSDEYNIKSKQDINVYLRGLSVLAQ